MLRHVVCLSILAAVASVGCQASSSDGETGGASAIVGGSDVLPGNPGASSAVAVGDGCTGVLVASDIVMTAAHCIAPSSDSVGFWNASTRTFDRRNVIEKKARLDDEKKPELQDDLTVRSSVFPNFDVAWVRFEGPLPDGYRPVEMLSDPSALSKGAPLMLVGRGVTSATDHDLGTMRTVDTVVDRYVDTSRVHGLFSYGPTPGKGECGGDSGGPAYIELDGRWLLAGIVNGSDARLVDPASSCNGAGIYTFAFPYKTWIEETATVTLAGPPGPPPYRFGVTPGLETFHDWCEARTVPLIVWQNLEALSQWAKSFDCAAIEAATPADFIAKILPEWSAAP
jgi:hypothetical protein